ncbi:outer membrane biogenesis protein BamB [Caulifigura coniformis]|uniref:Outer membrane biogenesis protein BamB n=1 Tax=Caulifigura coniformis TaxID=2527983 RepID=A0A517SJW6_9PLAN|nr:PQQ-binding-like beta-propeller repeat protein [Caulifigura coniformis]QDT56415.1 outer membrane biogenesis protein BamB [Caulifigura coniformis]
MLVVDRCRIAALLLPLFSAPAFAAEAWTSFQNSGNLELKDTVASGEGSPFGAQLWSAKLAGYGQSSPVLWKDRVFVTSIEGPNREKYHVAAYSVGDGRQLWVKSFANPSPREDSAMLSRAASTPAVDAQGLICFLEGGLLIALTHDGDIRWQRDLVAEFGPIDSNHGVSGSVEQQDDRVFVWVERKTEPYLVAVDKQTGKDLWKVSGVGATSWASPRLVPTATGQHLVLSAVGSLTGVDPESGKTLWKLEGLAGNSTPTPMPLGNGRFLIGATDGRGEGGGSKPAETNGVVAVTESGGTWSAAYVWKAKRATSSFGSPIAAGGNAYIVNRTGVLYCLDLETGEERYVERTPESVWCTPVADDHAVVLFGKGGTITALAKGPEFKLLGSMKLWTDEPETLQYRPMGEGASPAGEGRRPMSEGGAPMGEGRSRGEGRPPMAEGERPMGEGRGPMGGGRGGAGGPPSGPTLYGVAIVDGKLLARRGEMLFCLKYGSGNAASP